MPEVTGAAVIRFGFRGVRGMQALLATVVVLLLCGVAGMLWGAVTGGAWILVVTAGFLATVAAYLTWMVARLPNASVIISDESVRFSFPGAVDAAVPRSNVRSVELADHHWWQGLGIRTDLVGTVMLATATGRSAQFELAEPLRVWVIPRILPIRARRLRVSVDDPGRLVALFALASPTDAPNNRRS